MRAAFPAVPRTAGTPDTIMPQIQRPRPARMIHQEISLKRASIKSPSFTFRYTLMPMPVKIWITPRISDPIIMATISSRGVTSAGISKVLAGSMMLSSWGMKSPKKPPVRAPTMKVLMPHQKIISMK